jgi:hypothetical protein
VKVAKKDNESEEEILNQLLNKYYDALETGKNILFDIETERCTIRGEIKSFDLMLLVHDSEFEITEPLEITVDLSGMKIEHLKGEFEEFCFFDEKNHIEFCFLN